MTTEVLSLGSGAGTTTYAYDDADRLTELDPPAASPIAYTWDDNGNLTDRGADEFAWDYEDRMVSATVNAVTTSFVYRGDGLRDSRAVSGGPTTTFTWDIASGLPVVLDDGNQYVYGAGLTTMKQGGNWYYYLAHGLGSTMAVVDSSGNSQKSYQYDVYGEVTGGSGSLANEFDFAGQQTDGTELQYLRARYMDPETGTFLSRESLASIPSPWMIHGMSYAAGSPPLLSDETGLRPGEGIAKKAGKVAKSSYEAGSGAVKAAAPALKAAAPFAAQCAIWGTAGAAFGGGPAGALAGCAAGIISTAIGSDDYYDTTLQCLTWGAAGAVTAGPAGAALGCAAGIISTALADVSNPGVECGIRGTRRRKSSSTQGRPANRWGSVRRGRARQDRL